MNIEDLLFRDGDKSIEFSDCSDPGLVSALIELENYDDRIGWYLDTEEAVKVRDWLSAVIERGTEKASEQVELEAMVAQADVALARAEEIAKEASLMIEDEYHAPVGCRFVSTHLDDVGDEGEREAVTCWAYLVQDKLAEIRVEKLAQEGRG